LPKRPPVGALFYGASVPGVLSYGFEAPPKRPTPGAESSGFFPKSPAVGCPPPPNGLLELGYGFPKSEGGFDPVCEAPAINVLVGGA